MICWGLFCLKSPYEIIYVWAVPGLYPLECDFDYLTYFYIVQKTKLQKRLSFHKIF